MVRLRNAAFAVLTVGALALTACAGQEQSAGKDAGPDAMTLLRTEVQASLQNAANKTEKSKSMAFTMDMTVLGNKITSTGALSYGPPMAMTMTMNTPAGAMETRLIGTMMYLKVPSGAPAGKPWIKMDLTASPVLGGVDMSQMIKQMENCDPSKQIKALLETGKLTVIGEDTVDGVRTVHYKGTIPVDEYLKQVGPNMRAQQKANFDKLGIKEVTTELWVDEKYQPRKVDTTVGETKVQVRYSDFGKPVTVAAPPAAETASLAEVR